MVASFVLRLPVEAGLALVESILAATPRHPKKVAEFHGVKVNQAYAAAARLREILENISSALPFPPEKFRSSPKNEPPVTNK